MAIFPVTSRRNFLRTTITGASAVALHPALPAFGANPPSASRRLRFRHTHTNEQLDVVYWQQGAYEPTALSQIDNLLRDFRSNEIHPIDPALLDRLHQVYIETGSDGEYHIISAYRSPKTNAMLRNRSKSVATRSLHMEGKAIDIRLTDVPLSVVRETALSLKQGGVGYYPKSDFVHLDTGRPRFW